MGPLSLALALAIAASGQDELHAALASEAQGDLAAAQLHLEKAVQLSPYLGIAEVELADVLTRAGHEGPELDHALEEGKKMEPTNPRLWKLVGLSCESRQDGEGARAAFEKAISIRADDPQTHLHLAAIYRDQQRADDALAQFRAASELAPGDHVARLGLADSLIQHGDLPGAERELKRLVSEAPKSALYQQRLREVRVKRGEARGDAAPQSKRKLRPLAPSRR